MKYSKKEIKEYHEGIDTAREDWVWCKNNKKRINECIRTRYDMKEMCKKRNDKNGISFQNGYLSYFFNKLKNKKNI